MKLADLSVRDFVEQLGGGTPTPGGGSVAALCGALGAALSTMVARLTTGRDKFRDTWEDMEQVDRAGEGLAHRFLALVQEDSDAYKEVIEALRLPKETGQHRASRQEALQEAMKGAAAVPLEILRATERLIRTAEQALKGGNPVALTDAGAAVQLAYAAAAIAAYNVRINLTSIEDQGFVAQHKEEVEGTLDRVRGLFQRADDYLNQQLS